MTEEKSGYGVNRRLPAAIYSSSIANVIAGGGYLREPRRDLGMRRYYPVFLTRQTRLITGGGPHPRISPSGASLSLFPRSHSAIYIVTGPDCVFKPRERKSRAREEERVSGDLDQSRPIPKPRCNHRSNSPRINTPAHIPAIPCQTHEVRQSPSDGVAFT